MRLERGDINALKGEAFIYSQCHAPMQSLFIEKPLISAIYLTCNIDEFLSAHFWEDLGAEGTAAKEFIQKNSFEVSDFLSKINYDFSSIQLTDKYAVPFTLDATTCETLLRIMPNCNGYDIVCGGDSSNINECHAMSAKALLQYLRQYSEQNRSNELVEYFSRAKAYNAHECKSWQQVAPEELTDYVILNYLNPMIKCSKKGSKEDWEKFVELRHDLTNFFGFPAFMNVRAHKMASCASRVNEERDYKSLMELYLTVIVNTAQMKSMDAHAAQTEITWLERKLGF